MNQIKWVVAIVGLAAALALAVACGENDDDEGHTPAAAPAVAQQVAPASAEPRTTQVTQQVSGQQSGIWVSGVGKLSVEPDLVDFRVGVDTIGETVAEEDIACDRHPVEDLPGAEFGEVFGRKEQPATHGRPPVLGAESFELE